MFCVVQNIEYYFGENMGSSKSIYSCVVQNIEYFFALSEQFFGNTLMDVWNYGPLKGLGFRAMVPVMGTSMGSVIMGLEWTH